MSYYNSWSISDRQNVVESAYIIKKHFSEKATPKYVLDAIDGEEGVFNAVNDYSASTNIGISDELSQVFHINFKHQIATVFTVSNKRIIGTETKKIADLPIKMIKKAQQVIKTSMAKNGQKNNKYGYKY